MKKVIFAMFSLFFLHQIALAEEPATHPNLSQQKEEMFTKIKNMQIQQLQARIKIDQDTLNCIQAGQQRDDLKTCRKTAMQQMQNLRKSQKEQRKALRVKDGDMMPE